MSSALDSERQYVGEIIKQLVYCIDRTVEMYHIIKTKL